MTIKYLKQVIAECHNDIVFEYNNKQSGITSTVENSIPTFQVWHGNDVKEYSNVDDLIIDKFYSGKSLIDLIDKVVIKFV